MTTDIHTCVYILCIFLHTRVYINVTVSLLEERFVRESFFSSIERSTGDRTLSGRTRHRHNGECVISKSGVRNQFL